MKHIFGLSLLGLLGVTGCSIVGSILERLPPTITAFEAVPIDESGSSEVLFTWEISDPDSATLTCTLNFADASSRIVENCSQVKDLFHVYDELGTYVAQLSVTDGSNTRSTTEPIILTPAQGISPGDSTAPPSDDPENLITQFGVQSKIGPAPLYSIFTWELGDATAPVTCTLDYGDGFVETYEGCDETSEAAYEFFIPGDYRAVLTVQSQSAVATKGVVVVVEGEPPTP